MYLVLIRHGESVWNQENRFTGWTDVPLSEKGKKEAECAGELLKNAKIHFSVAYTSVLARAKDTLSIIQSVLKEDIPTREDWHLNERHYGALQGLNKDETRKKYGEEQVHQWRRSFDVRPPALTKEDERYPGNDKKYQNLTSDELPLTECLKDTLDRAKPYYQKEIEPKLKNENVLIVAHGNSLRAIRMYLENISEKDIMDLEIPTGVPFVYEFDGDLKVMKSYYLK